MSPLKINVKVHPQARKNEVVVIDEHNLKVQVTVAPENGKATQAVIQLLAKHYKVAKSRIHVHLGEVSRNKVFLIDLDE
jgi:uncharacterized protein